MKRIILLPVLLLCLLALLCAAYAESVPSLTLDRTELVLDKGRSQKVKQTLENVQHPKKAKITWETSDAAVATVDKAGTVRGKDAGSAVITCTAELEDGSRLTASVPVTVIIPVKSVKILTKTNTEVPFRQSLQIETQISPADATNQTLTWTSSNEEVLRVDENGVATALSAGSAVITATAQSGAKVKTTLKVPALSAPAETFEVPRDSAPLTFTYCGSDFDKDVFITAKGSGFTWSLVRNDPEIGIRFVALSPGEGTISVKAKKDRSSFTVRILMTENSFPAGRMLRIDKTAYNPGTGELSVTWTNTGASTVTDTELRICPRDAEGRALAAGDDSLGDILAESRVLHTSVRTAPGQTVTSVFPAGADWPDAASMDITFDRWAEITFDEDGNATGRTETELPEDRLCWYSAAQGAYVPGPENADPYTVPDAETLEKAARVKLGFTAVPVTADLAEAYGLARTGLLVVQAAKNSSAEAAGLLPGDLICSANGIPYFTDPYFLSRAGAEPAQDRPVTLAVIRDGAETELELFLPAGEKAPEDGAATATDLEGVPDEAPADRLIPQFRRTVRLTDRMTPGGEGSRIFLQDNLNGAR